MACPELPTDPLDQAAAEPKSVSGDQGTYVNHSLTEQIALDQYRNRKDQLCNPGKVLRNTLAARVIPPSARGS
jgi:hypothetical protein